MGIKPLALATAEENDAVRRLCDAVNVHIDAIGADAYGKFVAISLADGSSPDGVLYETRRDAARHQADPWNFYVKVNPGGIQANEAWVVLGYAREARKSGVVFSEEEAVVPQRLELGGSWLTRQRMGLRLGGGFGRAC